MRLLLPLLILLFSANAFSQCSECARTLGDTEKNRMDSNHQLMVGYQYASTWVVGKKTASYTYLAGQSWAFNLEYSTAERTVDIAKFEIGKIQEDRISLFAQYYLNNSFFVGGGPYYYEYAIDTAGSLRNALNQNLQQKWNIAGFGAGFIFGSRWQTDWGLTWGVDWVRLNIPFVSTWENKETGEVETVRRRDVDRTFEVLEKFPTIAFVGIQVGYTF
jgi:hypothetical protein